MNILFFDMEFANGKVPGSVYSLGYVQTNGKFELTEPQTDLLMNPECEWNNYVRSHILAYPMSTVKAAAPFPSYYKRIRRLLRRADLVVGFAVKNDTTALRKVCERYDLKPIPFVCLDLEPLCKQLKDYPDAHGLDGYVRAYCGIDPAYRHRSDGDAYASMLLLREICDRQGIHPKQIKKVFAKYLRNAIPTEQELEEENKKKQQRHHRRPRHRGRRNGSGAKYNKEEKSAEKQA